MQGILFFWNSIFMGAGLSMDAFSVSLVSGISEKDMASRRAMGIAGVYALFQALMPLTGWVLTRAVVQAYAPLERWIPALAMFLLTFVGGKMIWDSWKCDEDTLCPCPATGGELLARGVATSIDALTAGFAMSSCSLSMALTRAALIAAVTFVVCLAGIRIGKKVGSWLADRACIAGGLILICIGLEIFLVSRM